MSALQITDVAMRQMAAKPRHALIRTPIRMYRLSAPSQRSLLGYGCYPIPQKESGPQERLPIQYSNLSLPRSIPFLQKQCSFWQRAGEKLYKRPGGSYCPFSFTSSTCFSPELVSSKTTDLSHVGGSLRFNPESGERRRKWKIRATSS